MSTFAAEKVNEIVVGLSHDQINDLSSTLAIASDGLCVFYEQEINGWLSKQTFTNPAISEPNWDDAPGWANYFAQDNDGQCSWFANRPTPNDFGNWASDSTGQCAEILPNWKETLQQRPKPLAPKVEVGQFWRMRSSTGDGCELVALTEINDTWYAVIKLLNGQYPSYTKEEFFDLFELVQ